jgi:hypothetical protein
MDGDDGISCVEEVIVEEETLIPVETYDENPAVEIEIDPSTLDDEYEIGYGFWYKYLFRLPSRVELDSARENWLGIAGLTEDYDYGSSDKAGDRKLAVF